jgi:hypothetical protein
MIPVTCSMKCAAAAAILAPSLALPELHGSNPHWQYAAELLIRAAGDKKSVEGAEAQLRVALKAEGLI